MKTIIRKREYQKLSEVADLLGVDLEIIERHDRWTADFTPMVEIKNGPFLKGGYGTGATQEDAVEDLCGKISNVLLVRDAYAPTRKEVTTKNVVP